MLKNILLTGAFGNVGISTLNELLKKKYDITLFELNTIRNRRIARKYKKYPNVSVVWGDLREKESIRSSIIGKDIVIHVGAIIPPLADLRPKLAQEVNVGGTENILSVIREDSPNTKILFTSSIAVYGDRVRNPFIKKTDKLHPSKNDHYAETKIQAENLIKNSGVTYAIFRLTYIIEPYRVALDPLMFKMPLETCIEPAHTKDVGLAICNALDTSEDFWDNVYHIAGGEKCRITFKGYLDDMTEIFGLGRGLLPPTAFAKDGYHCGYMDTTESENILHYQRHSLKDIYGSIRKRFAFIRIMAMVFRLSIRHYLLSKSTYYKLATAKP